MPSTFLAIGRRARPCERARAKAGTAAADTARRSYRHSLISRVIATAAATSPRANRTITSARCAKQGAGSDTRLIPRHADADALRSASERSHGGHGSRGRQQRRAHLPEALKNYCFNFGGRQRRRSATRTSAPINYRSGFDSHSRAKYFRLTDLRWRHLLRDGVPFRLSHMCACTKSFCTPQLLESEIHRPPTATNLIHRKIEFDGRPTSLRLEPEFWDYLREIAFVKQVPISSAHQRH